MKNILRYSYIVTSRKHPQKVTSVSTTTAITIKLDKWNWFVSKWNLLNSSFSYLLTVDAAVNTTCGCSYLFFYAWILFVLINSNKVRWCSKFMKDAFRFTTTNKFRHSNRDKVDGKKKKFFRGCLRSSLRWWVIFIGIFVSSSPCRLISISINLFS